MTTLRTPDHPPEPTPHDSRLRGWRRDLHQHPETAFAEHTTSAYVASVLQEIGFEVASPIGGTGVVGSLTRGTSGRSIGLRADLDALPLRAAGEHDAMHACGHDGHMTMVLGAAAALAEHGGFEGTVRAVFQPAEEPGRGAQAMVDDGLFDRFPVDAMYGLHNLPGLPAGHVHTRPGGIMASEDNFEIRIVGRGGHAASPNLVIDPIPIAAEITLALQSVVARNVDPLNPAVLSCTDVHTDGARNAIPGEVRITGDTRSFAPKVQNLLQRRIRELAEDIASAHGAGCTVTYTHEFAPTVNDPDCSSTAATAATRARTRQRPRSR